MSAGLDLVGFWSLSPAQVEHILDSRRGGKRKKGDVTALVGMAAQAGMRIEGGEAPPTRAGGLVINPAAVRAAIGE